MAKLIIDKTEHTVPDGIQIDAICENEGVPFSCNSGVCGTCQIKVLDGANNLNELNDEETSQRGWAEFGTVTGRPRRAADFDFCLAKRAIMLNSATQIAITKLDIIFPECEGKTSYDELTDDAKSFIKNIEDQLNVPVTLLGTGPTVNDIIDRRK